jgi:exodeoxyribonuclease V alpha subunit
MLSSLEILTLAPKSSLVSNLSLALARRFAQSDFAALLIIMLNFRLENCRDVCLNLDKDLSFDTIEYCLREIFSSRSDHNLPLTKDDNLFSQKAAAILQKKAKRRKFFSLKQLLEENLKDFGPFISKAYVKADTPLIFDEDKERLYFKRYYDYECKCAHYIKNAIIATSDLSLEKDLNLLFPHTEKSVLDYQRLAVKEAYLNKFAIISGGPGTGKTTTVTKLLLLLLAKNPHLKIALTAPTGKAAARLRESIIAQKNQSFNKDELIQALNLVAKDGQGLQLLESLPENTTTVHRLLKIIPHQVIPQYNARHKLPFDVVLVDEVSMLDLALFHHLLEALKEDTRLILLGDRNQLSSVEAGAVLAEISSYALTSHQSFFTELKKSYRFKTPEIAEIAALINAPDFKEQYLELKKLNAQGKSSTLYPHISPLFKDDAVTFSTSKVIIWHKEVTAHTASALAAMALGDNSAFDESFDNFVTALKATATTGVQDQDIASLFKLLNQFRILCSNRHGPLGQNNLNALIADKIFQRIYAHKRTLNDKFFIGEVILITQNNQALGLANGDVGFCAFDYEDKALRFYFEGEDHDKAYRKVNPLFVSDYDLGYAMTIHKSQGSEYETIAVVTALELNSVLTAELIYTAITRAKSKVKLYCREEIFKEACSRRIKRSGGLLLRLLE